MGGRWALDCEFQTRTRTKIRADSSLNLKGCATLARKQGRDGHPDGQTVGDCDETGVGEGSHIGGSTQHILGISCLRAPEKNLEWILFPLYR